MAWAQMASLKASMWTSLTFRKLFVGALLAIEKLQYHHAADVLLQVCS